MWLAGGWCLAFAVGLAGLSGCVYLCCAGCVVWCVFVCFLLSAVLFLLFVFAGARVWLWLVSGNDVLVGGVLVWLLAFDWIECGKCVWLWLI